MRLKIGIACVTLALCVTSVQANDAAVETAVGGLKLRKIHAVSMEREYLSISRELVTVEYEFLNTTESPVSSEVAFPLPPFRYRYDDLAGNRDIADFKAWLNDKPIEVKKEVRAFVKGREVTAPLRKAGITIERFGNFDPGKGKGVRKRGQSMNLGISLLFWVEIRR